MMTIPPNRFQVPGSRFQDKTASVGRGEHGTWNMELGTAAGRRKPQPSTLNSESGTLIAMMCGFIQFQVPGSRFQEKTVSFGRGEHGTWNIELGTAAAKRRGPLFLLMPLGMVLLSAAHLSADSARSVVAEGNALYTKGKVEAALQKYTRAQALLPNSPLLAYNMGDVFFRQKDYDKAIESFGKAAQAPDKVLAEAAYFNAGNAQFAKEDYLQAVEMYKQALQLNSEDRDAKANLELARRKLKEQSKPQKQDQQQQQQQGQQQEQPPQQGQEKKEQGQEKNQPQPKPGDEKKEQEQTGAQKKEDLSKEEAARILEALQNKDKDEQKKQKQKVPVSGAYGGQDW